MGQEPTAKLIRSIGFGYALDFMPAPFLVGFNQMRRKLERAGFTVNVSLVPLSDVPSDIDILFVPAHLESNARKAAPGKWIIALDTYLNHLSYADVLNRLEDGSEIYALRANAGGTESGSEIVRYRGNLRID